MAGADLNPILVGLHRKIGDLVFYTLNGETVIRRKVESKNPRTPAQMEVRESFLELVEAWYAMGSVLRTAWDARAHERRRRGYNLFIGENAVRQRRGEAILLSPGWGDVALESMIAAPGASGQISCTFSPAPAAADMYLSIFTRQVTDGRAKGPVVRHDMGAAAASPCIIQGLEPGGTYTVHAVITPGEFGSARAVSRSFGMVTNAGA